MKQHGEFFGLRTFDIEKDEEVIRRMFRERRQHDQRAWEAYSWGKRPLMALAEGSGRTPTNIWCAIVDTLEAPLLFRFLDLNRHNFEQRFSKAREVVLDLSSVLTIAELEIASEMAECWTKALCTQSLWDRLSQETVANEHHYRQHVHEQHERFEAWLGSVSEGVPTIHEFWNTEGSALVATDSPEFSALGDTSVTLAWCQSRGALWLVVFPAKRWFDNAGEWSPEHQALPVYLPEVLGLLKQWGEITSSESEALAAFCTQRGVTSRPAGPGEETGRLTGTQKGCPLSIDYLTYGLFEDAQGATGVALLAAIRRSFGITISPLDLHRFGEELRKHSTDKHACVLSSRAAEVLKGWKETGLLEVVESKIAASQGGELVSAEGLGMPFSEIALAAHSRRPTVVDDLGTFEMLQGIVTREGNGRAHPSTGVPYIIADRIQSTQADPRKQGFWYDKMAKLWSWGMYGLPPTGVLAWMLRETNWRLDARPARHLLDGMTRFVHFKQELSLLKPEDLAAVGVSFVAGRPDESVAGRLSLFSLAKETALAMLAHWQAQVEVVQPDDSSNQNIDLRLATLAPLRPGYASQSRRREHQRRPSGKLPTTRILRLISFMIRSRPLTKLKSRTLGRTA